MEATTEDWIGRSATGICADRPHLGQASKIPSFTISEPAGIPDQSMIFHRAIRAISLRKS